MREINESWFRYINNLGIEYPFLNNIFVFFAEYTVLFLALFVIFLWFKRTSEGRKKVIVGVLAFLFAYVTGHLVGFLHFNYQPFIEMENVNQLIEKRANNSFPSDHTILFFSFCVSFWLFHKRNVFWLVLAVLGGASRIGVGVHYPFDVIVGATIAIVYALIFYYVVPKSFLIQKSLTYYENIEKKIWRSPKSKNNKDIDL
ncbi:hypothetical protein BTS2_1382 [Bacillus sp. TS-2]|nr:hypothetical protein BTS2_1382 [Bacillus sp. TS-2]